MVWGEKTQMDGLAPTLKCLIEAQCAIRNGEPVRAGLMRFVQKSSPRDEMAALIRSVLVSWDQGRDWRTHLSGLRSHRRALVEVLMSGVAGQSIALHLESLAIEIRLACDAEIREHLELLPVKMLAPLLLFQFPAFLILMFGPLLRHLVAEINR